MSRPDRRRPPAPAPDDEYQIIYGRRPVAEAQRGRRQVHRIWTADDLPADELTRMAGSPDHQGVVAEVDPYPYADPDPARLLADPDSLVIVLDQVQDPRNLGAICRSADAAGASAVVIGERRSAAITAAACKTSAGAVEHLPIARARNTADWLDEAKRVEGTWVYGAASDAQGSLWDLDLTGRVVLVMGSEGEGLRPRVAAACDGVCSIPMVGNVASLNVSVAAALLLFEARRQRR